MNTGSCKHAHKRPPTHSRTHANLAAVAAVDKGNHVVKEKGKVAPAASQHDCLEIATWFVPWRRSNGEKKFAWAFKRLTVVSTTTTTTTAQQQQQHTAQQHDSRTAQQHNNNNNKKTYR